MFLYTKNEISAKEIKKLIPFTTASKTNKQKYLGINLTKEANDLYSESYKTLMKKIKENTKMERYTVFMNWKN